jgi:hypothetical protein
MFLALDLISQRWNSVSTSGLCPARDLGACRPLDLELPPPAELLDGALPRLSSWFRSALCSSWPPPA